MPSTFPVNTLSTDYLLPTPFPLYEPDSPPSQRQDPPAFVFPLQLAQVQDVPPQQQLISDSNSDNTKPSNHAISSSGSDDDRKPNGDSNSRNNLADERKRKHLVSRERESARRSRMRKKRILEGLREQVNHLIVENRELMNRVYSVTHRCTDLQTNNEQIQAELSELRQTLWDIRR